MCVFPYIIFLFSLHISGILDNMKAAKAEEKKQEKEKETKQEKEELQTMENEDKKEEELAEKLEEDMENVTSKNAAESTKNDNKTKKDKKRKSKNIFKVKTANLIPEEVRLIHQNMVDQALDHSNLPLAVSTTPMEIDPLTGKTYLPVKDDVKHDTGQERDEAPREEQKEEIELENEETTAKEKKEKEIQERKRKEQKEKQIQAGKEREKKEKEERERARKEKEEKRKAEERKEKELEKERKALEAKRKKVLRKTKAYLSTRHTPANSGNEIDSSGNTVVGTDLSQSQPTQLQQVQGQQIQGTETQVQKIQGQQITAEQQPKIQLTPPVEYAYGVSPQNDPNHQITQPAVKDGTKVDLTGKSREENKGKQDVLASKRNPDKLPKTNTKLKQEIENMVDKAFGELLL